MKAKVKLILKLYISTNPGVNFSVPARDGTLLSILIVSQGGDLNSMFHKGQEGQKQKPLNPGDSVWPSTTPNHFSPHDHIN